MWFDAVFKTLHSEYYQNLQREKEEQKISLVKPENQIASLDLMDYLLPPESPQELELDFEIPDSDSGEKKLEEEKLLLDSTFTLKDSTKAVTDSLLAKEDTVKIDWRTLDSTARLEQFRFQREENPMLKQGRKNSQSFLHSLPHLINKER